jgi:hypothetical protein
MVGWVPQSPSRRAVELLQTVACLQNRDEQSVRTARWVLEE